ncbi:MULTISPECIES: helix-turn-helix domain-containing protein [unclassified Halomonas]|uniref:helix-turn-helix domain-containing protein n=1 Tax=Halomonas TaxID=2745 RepID=UPI0013B3ED7A|nr:MULTISPECIES: helix-turn-helix domain-containing protein [unclassified Halomonas]|tara:strand:+ start:389 stop:712 length:324 start_codon:yes stop_codon:yes gene_type:complete
MTPLMPPSEVAELLAISERKVYAIKHLIGYVALGGNVRFEREAVDAYIESCKRGPSREEQQKWVSRFDTAHLGTGGSSPSRVSAADISERLSRKRKQGSSPRSERLN